jgi:N-acetylglutamate synthase-like GNAT family acetyltransferase
MFSRISHFLKGPNPLHPSVWTDRLSPLTFRRFAPQDLPQCLKLYALNEPERFPEGMVRQYEKSLITSSSYFLVAENDTHIMASGGMSYFVRENTVVLCYGLVHPSHQGRGIGTALLLARLALLNPERSSYDVFIFALEKSFAFYRRFGFRDFQPWKDVHGDLHPSGCLLVTSPEIRKCRQLLSDHGITVPQDEDQIPFRKPAA